MSTHALRTYIYSHPHDTGTLPRLYIEWMRLLLLLLLLLLLPLLPLFAPLLTSRSRNRMLWCMRSASDRAWRRRNNSFFIASVASMFSSFSCVGRETSRIPEKIRGERRKTRTEDEEEDEER